MITVGDELLAHHRNFAFQISADVFSVRLICLFACIYSASLALKKEIARSSMRSEIAFFTVSGTLSFDP